MDPEVFSQTIDSIVEKIGEEKAAIIADDLGTFRTAQQTALDNKAALEGKIEDLTKVNGQLITANANLLQKIPVNRENQIVPNSNQIETTNIPKVSPFDEFGRLKK